MNKSVADIEIDDKSDIEKVKRFAMVACREYLGGSWANIGISDFQIKKIIGGLSNYTYMCEMDESKFEPKSGKPRKVLIKLYGQKKEFPSWLKFTLASSILSSSLLGPRLYGVFEQGQLDEYIEYPNMSHNKVSFLRNNRSMAKAIAKFHALDVPISKEPRYLFETLRDFSQQLKNVNFTQQKDIDLYEIFKSYNLDEEIRQLKELLKLVDSPVVFSHNDISPENTLETPHRLILIDYEDCSYNFRGFDLGTYFGKWPLNASVKSYPGFIYDPEFRASRDQKIEFIAAYIEEYVSAIKQKLPEPESQEFLDTMNLNVEAILNEANYFELFSHLIVAMWSLSNVPNSDYYNFDYMGYAMARADAYFRQKEMIFPIGFDCVRV